jgi:hypothetical protein
MGAGAELLLDHDERQLVRLEAKAAGDDSNSDARSASTRS